MIPTYADIYSSRFIFQKNSDNAQHNQKTDHEELLYQMFTPSWWTATGIP
jgi:hypothetical protein